MTLLTSTEAAAALGVKRTTLYSYVSRGLIRTVPGPDGRRRRYLAADVEALCVRASASRGHRAAAAGAVSWGAPLLHSAITSIDVEGPNYRGHSAIALAERDVPFEDVVELLWDAPLEAAEGMGLGLAPSALTALLPSPLHPLTLLAAVVPLWGARADTGLPLTDGSTLREGWRLIRRIAAALAWMGPVEGRARRIVAALEAPTLASGLTAAWGAPAEAIPLVNLALVLCADHELNASSFAARVTAGTGADLYACVQSALAALSGPRHGRASDLVEHLLDEASTGERSLSAWLADRLTRGDPLPGFGHPLYPEGDPRGRLMLERAPDHAPRAGHLAHLLEAARALGCPPPDLDVGLVALRIGAELPRGAGAALFAVGRTAGWVAHAREQALSGAFIRPRARYVGR